MQGEVKREIRRKADSFRDNCKIVRYGITDLFKECERCGYKVIRYPLGEDADLGFVTKKDEDIVIFINSSSRFSREIFTLAHEIGHIILHFEGNHYFVDDKATISDKDHDEKEQQANYFAACLLMPEDVVRKYIDYEVTDSKKHDLSAMDIARIMSEFNVSFDMAINRLESLGIIDANQKICLGNEKTEHKVGNLLQSVGGNARLNTPDEGISIPHEYIDYVIYNYNHNAIPKDTLERVLKYYKLCMEDISDRIKLHEENNPESLEDLIGGLPD
ncbi:MAG: ImmA/IrrE family metallo-endopeptidase [Lachnospiraceae bacterium]|nr:ImmA/IrrE family metallo-endopeptidase [Lachnospiraceae bacterium]